MKKVYCMFTLVLTVFLTGCDPFYGKRPVDQIGTFWVSESPKMYFKVDEDFINWNAGILLGEENINISLLFDFGAGVLIEDTSKYIFPEDGGLNSTKALLFKGNCKFAKTKLTITVTKSNIDSVAVEDKIVFKRVDELPEWAAELAEAAEAYALERKDLIIYRTQSQKGY